jgi:hypothetical protein
MRIDALALLGVVVGHLFNLVGRGDECATELPGVLAAQPEGFRVAVVDHDLARRGAVCPLRAVDLNNNVAGLVDAFDNRGEPLK